MNEEEVTRSMRSLVAEAAGTEHAAGESDCGDWRSGGRLRVRSERRADARVGPSPGNPPARGTGHSYISVEEQSNITCSRRPHSPQSNRRAVRKTAREPDGAFGWLIGPFALARPAQLRVGPRLTFIGVHHGVGSTTVTGQLFCTRVTAYASQSTVEVEEWRRTLQPTRRRGQLLPPPGGLEQLPQKVSH